jgi:hypothetical protein
MLARNSTKTLKCPKCNWHYKYQETLEIHMKEKHADQEVVEIGNFEKEMNEKLIMIKLADKLIRAAKYYRKIFFKIIFKLKNCENWGLITIVELFRELKNGKKNKSSFCQRS